MNDETKNGFTTSAPAPHPDPERVQYRPKEAKQTKKSADPNSDEPLEDHVYGIESRARWPTTEINELHHDSMGIDGTALNSDTHGSDEDADHDDEDVEPGKMTVEQLKEALDEAELQYSSSDKKPALVKIYSDWLADQ